MTASVNLTSVSLALGMSEEEALQITNIGQTIAFQSGLSFNDAITITSLQQGNAIAAGIELSDSLQFNSQIKIDAFIYINSLTGAVYENSIAEALQFSRAIQLYAYKTGYVTVAQALLYTNNEQLLTLESTKTHSIAIKKLPKLDSDNLEIDSTEWKYNINSRKLFITQQNSLNYFTVSAIICNSRNSWANTFDKRLDVALKNDLSILFPSCTPCVTYASGCLECLDYIMRDVNGCQKSQISCDRYSFEYLIRATEPSLNIATAVANEICDSMVTLSEEGVAAGLSESEANQLTNKGQLLAVISGKTFSEAIQIQNYWQGLQIKNVPSTTLTDALKIQNYGNYVAFAAGIPSPIAESLNTASQVRIFSITQDLSFAQTYGDKPSVQYALVKGVDKTIAQQFTLLCQAAIYCAIPSQQTLDDVLTLTNDNQCKAYIYNGQNATAASSLSIIEELFFSNLHLTGTRCIGTQSEMICVEGVI